ncbi:MULTISPECIES: hypothetical protein [unclassified Thioalkalivibrio]|uniref:hypothetical protein n=1 Tax=unclassified Thioalkalivibrio TaxID=2621013 RepID=UPI000377B029|nr:MULTISPECIES: hypothetical protein [unclassified Thioalkalivibrio]
MSNTDAITQTLHLLELEDARDLALEIRTGCKAIASHTDPDTAALLKMVAHTADRLAGVLEEAAPSIAS